MAGDAWLAADCAAGQIAQVKKELGNKSKSAHDNDGTLSKEVDAQVDEASRKVGCCIGSTISRLGAGA